MGWQADSIPLPVTRGLDRRVHLLRMKMDCPAKPGNDGGGTSACSKGASHRAGCWAQTVHAPLPTLRRFHMECRTPIRPAGWRPRASGRLDPDGLHVEVFLQM